MALPGANRWRDVRPRASAWHAPPWGVNGAQSGAPARKILRKAGAQRRSDRHDTLVTFNVDRNIADLRTACETETELLAPIQPVWHRTDHEMPVAA